MLGACGGGAETGPIDDAARDEVAPVPDAPDESALDAEIRDPETLGVVRIALQRPPTVDPTEISLADQESVLVTDLLYDGLTEVSAAGDRLEPALASAWTVNDQLTEWTFVVDSDRVDPRHVAEHFARVRDETSAAATIGAALVDVSDVQTVGSDAVRFRLDRPDAGFAWMLSGVAFSVVGESGETTGQYQIESESDRETILTPGTGDGPTVVLHWAETADDAYDTLTLGLVDAAVAPPDAVHDAADRFGAVPPARAITRFYGINADSPRLADERVRRALIQAIDRDRLVDEVLAVPAFSLDGVLAPTIAGYGHSGCGLECRFDREAAAVALDAVADDGDPPVVRIAVADDGQAAVAAAIARDLEAVGFDTVVDELALDDLVRVIADGDADLFATGAVAVASSIDAVIPELFASDSPGNALRLRSDEVDRLLAEAAVTADDHARWDLLNEAHDAAMSSALVLPIAATRSSFVAAPHAQHLAVRADGSLALWAAE